MSLVTRLTCVSCQREYNPQTTPYTCPTCGTADGILDVHYDMAAARKSMTWEALAKRPLNHWRYRELLPLDEGTGNREQKTVKTNERAPGPCSLIPDPFSWPVGWTPIVEAPRLAKEFGIARIRLKDEGRNSTSSFKDRASSVGVARAMAASAKTIACASTGNAASSLAGYAAMAGMPAVIFVPQHAPEPKIAQLLIYGATVFRVQGTYAQAYDLCMQSCEAMGWYNRNCAINPYLVEGKKTAGLEIAEQCRHDPPDWVSVSVGDGCTIAGIEKGLRQMRELGLIDWRTKVLGVQAEKVAPISQWFRNEKVDASAFGPTVADSIDVAVPRNPRKAIDAVRESGGAYVEATDRSILCAIRSAGRLAGVFAEPAAAAAIAGVRVAIDRGFILPSQNVLCMVTGSGLKDIKSAMLAAGAPIDIPPELSAVKRMFEE
jgi:threonine synthase